ncbi:MAG TPA: hypothetical protein VL326_18955 [Kofleriaceae bacterium]|jgi:hypothetical protein|nr:hypothetical protein [Kofleriaceae bacterium]
MLVLLAAGACRFEFAEHDDAGAVGDGTDLSSDATDATLGPCTQWGTFAAPVHLTELGWAGDDWDPTVTADELEIFFSTARSPTVGSFDIYSATRSSQGAAFSTPVDVGSASSTGFDGPVFISEDGLTMVVTSDNGTVSYDLWTTTRPTRQSPFATPVPVAGPINSGNAERCPWLSPDGLRLYFSSDRLTGGEIFVSSRATVGDAFGTPAQIAELGSPFVDMRFTLSHDELEGFLVSDRGGNFDIYRSTRPSLASPFSTPVRVPELSSAGDDMSISLAPAGDTVYFAYNAVAAGGNAEVWSAKRQCLAH